jgi:methionyl-tRNA synthetase
MSAVGLMPRKETKDGKTVVDFNGFTMNTAQVIELARIPAAQFEEFEKQCEQLGVSDLTTLSSTVIRDMVKKFLGIESKSKKAIADKQTEEQAEEQTEEQTVQAKEVTKEDALATIVELMAKYNITIAEIKKQVRA